MCSNSGIENQEEIVSQEQCLEHHKNRNSFIVPPPPPPPATSTITATDSIIDGEDDIVKLIDSSVFDCKIDQYQQQDQEEESSRLLETLKAIDSKLNLTIKIATPSTPNEQQQRDSFSLGPEACVPNAIARELLPLSSSLQTSSKSQGTSINPTAPTATVTGDTATQATTPNSIPVQCYDLLSPYTIEENLPTPATVTIFAPRTADMNPGFLMPIGDENNCGLTVLPDIEACNPKQDLTHLAPQAGDYCVPLEVAPLPIFDGLMDELLKEMGLVDNSVNNEKSETLSALNDEGKLNNTTITTRTGINSGSKLHTQQIRLNAKTSNCNSDTSFPINVVCKNDGSFMDEMNCKNEMLLHDSDEENLPFTGYLTSDSELSPFISNATDPKISSNDGSNGPNIHDSINELDNSDCSIGANILSTFISSPKTLTTTATSEVSLNSTLSGNGNQLNEEESSICCSPCPDVGPVLNSHNKISVESALHNDPFLSFTNGCLLTDNFLSSNLSSTNSFSNSPTFYTSSNMSQSPLYSLKRSSSSLCDSPPPSSCNSTLTSDLDICGSFGADDDDVNNNILDNTSKKSLDDSFSLLSNDDFIWDSLIHSNISDLVSDGHDDILSDDKAMDDILNQDTSSSTNSCSNGSSSLPLNSNLAMLLQKDSHLAKPLMVTGKNDFFATKKNQGKSRLNTYSSHTASRSSSVDNRINSNFYLVQNNRTGKSGINGLVDVISALSASQIRSSSSWLVIDTRFFIHL